MEGVAGIKLVRSTSNCGVNNSSFDRHEVVKLPRVPGFLKLRKDLMKEVVSDDHLMRVCPMKGVRKLGKQMYRTIPPIAPQIVDSSLVNGSNSAGVTNATRIVHSPEEYAYIGHVRTEFDNVSQESASIQSMTSKEILAKPNQQQTLLKYKLGTAPQDKAKLIEMKIGMQYIKSIESMEQINNEKLNTDNNMPIVSSNTAYVDAADYDSFNVSVENFGITGNLNPIKASVSSSIFPSAVSVTGQVSLVVVASKVSASNSVVSDDYLGERVIQPSIDIEIVEKKKESLVIAQSDAIQDFDDEVSHDGNEMQQQIKLEEREVRNRGIKYAVKKPGAVNLGLYRLRIPSPKSPQRKSFLDADYAEPIYTPSSFRRPRSEGSRSVSPSFNATRRTVEAFDERFDLDKYFDETMKDVISAVENHVPPNNMSRNRSRGTSSRGVDSRGVDSRGVDSRGVDSRGGILSRKNELDEYDSRSRGAYSSSKGSGTVDMVDFIESLSVDAPPPEFLQQYDRATFPDGCAQTPLLPETFGELSGIEYYLSLLPKNMTKDEELGILIGENKDGSTVQFNQIEKIVRPVHVDYPVNPVFLDGKGNVRLLEEMKYIKLKHIATTFGMDISSNMGQLLHIKLRAEAKSTMENQLNVQLHPRVVYYEAPTINEVLTPAQRTLRNLERLNKIEAKGKKEKEIKEREKQDMLEEKMKAKGLKIKKKRKKKKNDLKNELLDRPIAYSVNTSGRPNAALLAVSTSYVPSPLAYEPLTGITKSCELVVKPDSTVKRLKSANIVICKNVPVYQISEEEKGLRKRREEDEQRNKAKISREKRKSVISRPVGGR